MNDFNREITKENIFLLLRYSGLTDEQFANILGISIRWLGYIKSGKYDFKISEIEKASKFFTQAFNNLTSKQINVGKNLRENLIASHKNNDEYLKILLDNPTIPYAIEFKLLDDPDFQDRELEIKEINKIFNKSDWSFKSSSLTNGLKTMKKFIQYRSSPNKKGTHLYSKNNKDQ